MTSTQSAVRAACDNGGGLDWECRWPECRCGALSERHIATLLANARAEAAGGEREACAQLMETHNEDEDGDLPEPILKVRRLGRKLRAAAIRARAAKEASGG